MTTISPLSQTIEQPIMNLMPPCPGTLFVIAAPSGAGKTSLTRALIQTMPNIELSISHTTRPQRPAEEVSKDYFFVDQTQFEDMIVQDAFLEHAQVFGFYYGTTRAWVEKKLAEGMDIILEIDWQGAEQVRKAFPDSIQIFILPPTPELLRQRLQNRNQDETDVIEKRLAEAGFEVAHYRAFDYIVINDVFENALGDLQSIVRANRLKTRGQAKRYAKLLAELTVNK
jgi:guanylate kinase